MEKPVSQNSSTALEYPRKGTIDRFLYKLPLLVWRMGYGPLLSHPSRGGSRMLVLTAMGRKSGQPRHTMVSHIELDGRDYVLSGWGSRSQWVQNILIDPLVTVQVYRHSYPAVIYRVTEREEFSRVTERIFQTGGDSHFEPWLASLEIEKTPRDLIAKQDRVFIFGLNPVDRQGPEPLKTDLVWVHLPVLAAFLSLIWLLVS
jgi:deazaflavin-dependent oxidoreductase (nitroreductase family)